MTAPSTFAKRDKAFKDMAERGVHNARVIRHMARWLADQMEELHGRPFRTLVDIGDDCPLIVIRLD